MVLALWCLLPPAGPRAADVDDWLTDPRSQLPPGERSLNVVLSGDTLSFRGVRLRGLRVEIAARLEGAAVSLRAEAFLAERLLGTLALRQEPGGGGRLELRLHELRFSEAAPLSALLTGLPWPADLVAGSLSGQASLRWEGGFSGLHGPLSLSLEGIGGYYGDIWFTGLDSRVEATMESIGHLSARDWLPASLESLGVGVPIEDLSWRYRFDTAEPSVSIESFRASLLGGDLTAASFDYRPGAAPHRLLLRVEGLDLERVAALAQRPELAITGELSGELPISLTAEGISVDGGRLYALPPGGEIRYRPARPPEDPSPHMALVYDALSNYRFDSLQAGVDYNADGDLLLALELQGINPEMESERPVHLNVNVSDHLPTLIRSLQAARSIREALEQQLRDESPQAR